MVHGAWLPMAAVYVHGPDIDVIDYVTEQLLLASDSSIDLEVTFMVGGVTFSKDVAGGEASVSIGGYIIPGPSFELSGTRQWLYILFDVQPVINPICGEGCWVEGSGACHCVQMVWNGYGHTLVEISDDTPYLVTAGIIGDVAFATYRLYARIVDFECRPWPCEYYIATDEYMNATLVKPSLTSSGYVIGWVEADPAPFTYRAAWQAYQVIAANWDPVDYGWQGGNIHITSFSHADRVGTIPLLSAGIGIPVKPTWPINVNLLGVGVGLTKRHDAFSLVTISVKLDREHRIDYDCELHVKLFRSPVYYQLGSSAYPIAVMYADVYVRDGLLCLEVWS